MQIQGNKIILTTFESGSNHYYDSTFNLRPYIEPNSKGLYTVQINEFWFKNNEATLEAGDWIEFRFEYSDASSSHREVYRCTLKDGVNVYTYSEDEGKTSAIKVIDQLFSASNSSILNRERTVDGAVQADSQCTSVTSASFRYKSLDGAESKLSGSSWGMDWFVRLELDTTSRTYSKVSMSFSNNYCYLFNRLAKEVTADLSTAGCAYFNFFGVRLSGPYIYLVDTSPLQSELRTINANNEIYNITALSYNSSFVHNSIIQGSSSMRMKTRDLTNLRIRLMNDQFDLVKIREPLYIQLTVTNDED